MGVETIYSIKEKTKGKKKVAPRFELGMEALQASALPLGYATTNKKIKKFPKASFREKSQLKDKPIFPIRAKKQYEKNLNIAWD
jgi:hypothetical protein